MKGLGIGYQEFMAGSNEGYCLKEEEGEKVFAS
jgi:hypothetical protein